MAGDSPYKTAEDIIDAVITDSKEASTTNLRSQLLRWINEGQELVMNRKKREWLDTTFSLQTAARAQANANVSSGSTNVNFGTATLPSAALDLSFKVSGFEEVYKVSTISGGIVTLELPYLGDSNTAATGNVFQEGIVLDGDIETVYQVYHHHRKQPLIELSPQQFRELQSQQPDRLDFATHYTLYDDSSTGARRLRFYPAPKDAYTIYIDAKQYPTKLAIESDEPVIPIQHRQMLYHYAMSKLYDFHRNLEQRAFYLNNFTSLLRAMDGEFEPQDGMPTLKVRFPRPNRRRLFAKDFDERLRDS